MSTALSPRAQVLAMLSQHDTILRTPINPDQPVPTSLSILSAIVEYGPSGAESILHHVQGSRLEEADSLVALAKHWRHLIHFYKATLGSTPHNRSPAYEASSEDDDPTYVSTAERQQGMLKSSLQLREGWLCLGPVFLGGKVGWFDRDAPAAIMDQLEMASFLPARSIAAHILPFASALTEQDVGTERATKKRDFSASLSAFMGTNELAILLQGGVAGINSPSNALLLTASFHESFGAFESVLEPDTSSNTPHSYQLIYLYCKSHNRNPNQTRSLASTEQGAFTFNANCGVPVPSALYLATHAALAKVFHASGMAEAMIEYERDEYEIDQMEAGERRRGLNPYDLADRLAVAEMSMPRAVVF